VVDGNLISSRRVADLADFMRAYVQAFAEGKKRPAPAVARK
jgi:hypothetical protein